MAIDPAFLTRTELPVDFGRYRLTALLGEGGMGKVFKAELRGPAGFRKELAIKVMRESAVASREDFVREAQLGGLLKHPNLVDVYEFDAIDEHLFLVMEYVRGVSLSKALRELVTLPVDAALQVARQICVALAHAHGLRVQGRDAGLVHGDLKPANVLLGRDGLVKVLDLGVAWAAGLFGDAPQGQLRGTISWMAPEQLLGDPVDHRADLFAVGVLLTVMTLGHHPFRRATPPATANEILRAEDCLAEAGIAGQLDAVAPGLADVVLRCLRLDPARRYPTAGALASDLARLLTAVAPGPGLAGVLGDLVPDLQTDELVGSLAGSSRAASSSRAALLAASGPRTNIAAPRDAFFGREEELSRLGALFDGGVRLVTLKATGGAGKTRLASHFASGRALRLEGGAWLVSLADARTRVGVVHAVADALGLRSIGEPEESLAAALADREPTLLVLDNAENVAEEVAQLVTEWLGGSSVQLLVTSRRPLGLAPETVVELGALDSKQGTALFRERAVRTSPGWEPTRDDLEQLPQLVRRLDGLPLAIELAAARVGTLGVRELLARLSQRFKLLRSTASDDPRQATMASTIAWSWDQLQPWEQAALAQLTAFLGGFGLDEAELQVDLSEWPDAPWTVDVVDALLRQSLLRSEPVEGRPRFTMYESVRDFAARTLSDEELAAAHRRHSEAFARLGRADAFDALDRRGGSTLRRRLVREMENLVVATERAVDAGLPDVAALCGIAALEALDLAGPVVVAENLARRVLAFDALDPELRIRLLTSSAWCRRRTSFRSAQRRLDRAIEHARTSGARSLLLRAQLMHAGLAQGNSNDAGLVRAFEELAWQFEELGDLVHSGRARAWKGSALYHQGRMDEARAEYDEALALLLQHGGRRDELHVRTDLAMLHLGQGRLEEADDQHARSLRLARATGDRFREAVILGNLGVTAMTRQDAHAAQGYLRKSAAIHRDVGARAQEGICLLNLGQIKVEQGDLRRARRYLSRGMELCRRTWPLGSGAAASMLAYVTALEGRYDDAEQLIQEAQELLADGVDRVEEGKMWARGAQVAHRAGRADVAAARLAKAREAQAAIGAGPQSDLSQLIEAAAADLA